jgi:cobalt-zinc-cadmium efflux system outer membrane protein
MISLRAWCSATLLTLAALGCKTAQVASTTPGRTNLAAVTPATPRPNADAGSAVPPVTAVAPVAKVNFQEALPHPADQLSPSAEDIVGDVLSREWLQAEVEARNPSLEAMVAAWQAAARRYPQQIALDDPMLMGMIAPESGGSDVTETAYALQLNQKLPWFGKRRLRGAAANADADAAFQDAEDSRLQVRLAADMAFFEYFMAARLIEINRENTQIAQEFLDTAQARYRANQVTNQDVLQAELELADLARRQLELRRMQQVAIARINTLLRRWPDAPLPAPPASLEPPLQPADPNILWQTALRQRPDLAALAWRVQSEEAALELGYKNFFPDFDVFGRYDTFWQPSSTQGPLRAEVGVAMNVPIYREKLRAAVAEAQFRVNQRRAEFEQRSLEIQYEAISASQQVEESRKTVELYAQRLLPAAEQNVAAARSNYEVNKISFIDLALTQRQLIAMREKQIEAVIAYHRRVAELNRVTGGVVMQAP